VARTRAFLEGRGAGEARLEAELLVAEALSIERLRVFLELDRPLTEPEVTRARELVVRRGRGEPCAYVIGKKEFYGRSFEVGPGVLVPRPETEYLVDLARERLRGRARPSVFDLGTGSGCIALTLFFELEEARVVASDLSERALAFARANAARLGAKVELLLGDGFEPVRGRRFDCIVSNPPYVDPAAAGTLAREVREFEPPEALFAPAGDRDHWVRRLAREAPAFLEPGGVCLVELGHDQARAVRAELEARCASFRIHEDLAGIERVLELSRLRDD